MADDLLRSAEHVAHALDDAQAVMDEHGIEGACRHLIKDRMERAGMHWTMAGAQAMLDVRSVWIGGHWSTFQQQRIEHETDRLYPHRKLVAGDTYFNLAV